MKTKLLVLTLLLTTSVIFSQDIGFLGEFNNWGDDVDMVTSDNTVYTKTNYYLPVGNLKFRENNGWNDGQWGGDTFPSGPTTGNNLAVTTAGFYDITLNIVASTYSFVSVAGTNQNVSIIGDFNGWVADFALSTSDNINYTATNVAITGAELKFRRDGNWSVSYGSASLSGTATPGGANIPIPADGNYNFSFNIETLVYSVADVLATEDFEDVSINIFSFDNKINIKGLASNENYSLTIFDTMGRQVKSLTSNADIVDISELNTAVYFLVLETAEGNIIRKKIIQ